MITRLENVTLVTPARLYPGSTIDVEDKKILAVYTAEAAPVADATVIDCNGSYAMPGFVDIHLHGGGGFRHLWQAPELRLYAGVRPQQRHGAHHRL